jgi:hypothetical protein
MTNCITPLSNKTHRESGGVVEGDLGRSSRGSTRRGGMVGTAAADAQAVRLRGGSACSGHPAEDLFAPSRHNSIARKQAGADGGGEAGRRL